MRLQTCNFIKKKLQRRCFPKNLSKFLRTPFFKDHIRWLLNKLKSISLCQVRNEPKKKKKKLRKCVENSIQIDMQKQSPFRVFQSLYQMTYLLIKLHVSSLQFIKKILQHRYFPVSFTKFLQHLIYSRTCAIGCFWKSMHKSK